MFGKAHARCTQKQGQAECRKRMGEQVYNKVAAIICLADWPRTDSAQWCLAGEMKQRLLVVGGAELLVLLHKGRQVDVLLQELLVQLLRLLVQLCHWCWAKNNAMSIGHNILKRSWKQHDPKMIMPCPCTTSKYVQAMHHPMYITINNESESNQTQIQVGDW